MQNLDSFFQKQFKIDKIIIDSSKRSKTLTKWQSWFNMDIIEENENYTDLKLEGILLFIGFKMRLNLDTIPLFLKIMRL